MIIVITLENEAELLIVFAICYKASQKGPIFIHNRSTYDDHFIVKQLPEEFKGKFEMLMRK